MNNINIPKIQIIVTTRCNLKCRLCSGYCPYIKDPHDVDFNTFKRDVTKYFEIVDRLERLELTGGEPMVNPHLPDMIKLLCEYGDRVDDFRLLTNGRSLPGPELLSALKNSANSGLNFAVLIDNYGPELSCSAEEAAIAYEKTGVKVIMRDQLPDKTYMGGFADHGMSKEFKRTYKEIKESPEKCAAYRLMIRAMWEGAIYSCGRSIYYYSDLVPPPKPPNCVFIHDETKTLEQLREELRVFGSKEFYESCCYCYGISSANKRRYPPAEQLD